MRIARTIAEIRQYIRVNINFMPNLLLPSELDAQDIVSKIIGKAQYEDLLTAYTNSTLSTEQTKLLPYVQRTMVALTFLIYADEGQLEISASGININVSQERKTAFQWQITELKKQQKKRGFTALENLLMFLQNSNVGTYPIWENSPERAEHLKFFINNSQTFSQNYQIRNDFSLFLFLRETLEDVEEKYILPIIGKQLFDEIKVQILTNTVSATNKELLKLINRACAWKTIGQAIPKLVGYVDEFGITDEYTSMILDANAKNPSTNEVLSLKLRTIEQESETYISKLNDYLIANAGQYPLFIVPQQTDLTINKERGFYTVL